MAQVVLKRHHEVVYWSELKPGDYVEVQIRGMTPHLGIVIHLGGMTRAIVLLGGSGSMYKEEDIEAILQHFDSHTVTVEVSINAD